MALIKFFTPQLRRLFEGGVYLKVGRNKELFQLMILLFSVLNLVTADFDYNGAAVLLTLERLRSMFTANCKRPTQVKHCSE